MLVGCYNVASLSRAPEREAVGQERLCAWRHSRERRRAATATLLYHAPEGLTIFELMQWLGHKDPKTTQHYARVKPTKLAAAYSKAERNSR